MSKELTEFLAKMGKEDAHLKKAKLRLRDAEDVKNFLDAIHNPLNVGFQLLTELDLSRSNLASKDVHDLVLALDNLPNLTTLQLNSCNLSDADSSHLTQLTHVKHLYLRNNAIREPVLSPHLESLNLDYNPIIKVHGLTSFNSALKSLSLAHCALKCNQMMPFLLHGKKLPQLTKLNLRKNELGIIGTNYITGFPALETLDLSQNKIEDGGIRYLKKCSHLKTLYLDECDIRSKGLKIILQMTLETVDLSRNFKLKGSWSDAALTPSKTLQSVKLAFSSLADADVKPMTALLPNLTSLNVANNNIKRTSIEQILNQYKNQLKKLDISSIAIHSVPAKASDEDVSAPKSARKKASDSDARSNATKFLMLIRTLDSLTSINLASTGITEDTALNDEVLAIFAQDGEKRKLKSVNGMSFEQFKTRFDVKPHAEQPMSSARASEPAETTMLVEQADPVCKSSDQQIVELLAENQRLRNKIKDLEGRIADSERTQETVRPRHSLVPPLAFPKTELTANSIFSHSGSSSSIEPAKAELKHK